MELAIAARTGWRDSTRWPTFRLAEGRSSSTTPSTSLRRPPSGHRRGHRPGTTAALLGLAALAALPDALRVRPDPRSAGPARGHRVPPALRPWDDQGAAPLALSRRSGRRRRGHSRGHRGRAVAPEPIGVGRRAELDPASPSTILCWPGRRGDHPARSQCAPPGPPGGPPAPLAPALGSSPGQPATTLPLAGAYVAGSPGQASSPAFGWLWNPAEAGTAVPVRAAMAAGAAAVVAITTAAVFVASLRTLAAPHLGTGCPGIWGQLRHVASAERVGKLRPTRTARRHRTGGSSQPAQIDGHRFLSPPSSRARSCRQPSSRAGALRPDEIALGSLTMRTLGKRLDDTVTFNAGPQPRQLRVVGRVVLNEG